MLETSSIQELSNSFTLTRGEKANHSPHSSPRPLRKALPNIPSQLSTTSVQRTESNHASSSSNANVNGKSSKSSIPMSMAGCSGVSHPNNKNQSISGMGSSGDNPSEQQSASNKHHVKTPPNNDSAPPLPPRKSNSVHSNSEPSSVNRPAKPQASSSLNEEDLIDMVKSPEPMSPVHTKILPTNTIPVPPNVSSDFLTGDLLTGDFDLETDTNEVIVGQAETITGFIDTRPYDQRPKTSFAIMANSPATGINLITINDTEKEDKSQTQASAQSSETQKTSNTYLLNNNFQNNNHQRTSSAKNQTTVTPAQPPKTSEIMSSNNSPMPPPHRETLASTSSSSSSQDIEMQLYENVNVNKSPMPSHRNGGFASQQSLPQSQTQHQATQKMTISNNLTSINLNNLNNNANSSASYENINLEYINKLVNEGYSKESVVKALGISGNNIEMACHILHEFVSKNSMGNVANN